MILSVPFLFFFSFLLFLFVVFLLCTEGNNKILLLFKNYRRFLTTKVLASALQCIPADIIIIDISLGEFQSSFGSMLSHILCRVP